MVDTVFVSRETIIEAAWLNDVNALVYTTFAAHVVAYDAHVVAYEAHVANVANPHSVTKTQVGLSSVTDDAQLKIASNLSDLNNAGTARTNLGLGTIATQAASNIAITGGAINLADGPLTRPEIKDYAVAHTTPTISAGAITFDCALSNSFNVSLTANITSITFSNSPATGKLGEIVIDFQQDGTGSRTVTWPASVKWSGGVAPVITTTLTTGRDKVFLSTRDGGTTWLGEFAQDYS